jgi:hypothetical protein
LGWLAWQVDYCGSSVSRDPAPQYAGFAALRDALNSTVRGLPPFFPFFVLVLVSLFLSLSKSVYVT